MQQTLQAEINFDVSALTEENAHRIESRDLAKLCTQQQKHMDTSLYYTLVNCLAAAPSAYVLGTVTGNPLVALVTFGAGLFAANASRKDYKNAKTKTEILTNEIGVRQERAAETKTMKNMTEIPGRVFGIDPMSAYIAISSMRKDAPKPG